MAFGVTDDDRYAAYVVAPGDEPRLVCTSDRPLGVGRTYPPGTGGLSADGALVCVRHADHGDLVHQALRVHDARDGTVVGELVDPGSNLDPVAFAPRAGDPRLLFTSELGPFERPALWDPTTGERTDLKAPLPGAAIPLGWWPDGTAVLVRHEHEGRDELYRLDPGTGAAQPVSGTGGEVTDAAVRPDGAVWMRTSSSTTPPEIRSDVGTVVVAAGDPAPPGRPYRPFWFENGAGWRVQGWVVTPDGSPPFPTVMSVHGGPEWHHRDAYDPETQALVDAGFAVALVNYRGSTGYGVAFRQALIGNPWFPESEDVVAGLDALVAEGVVDPHRVGFTGRSWGGCLACLCAGRFPDRWRAVVAAVPSGDFVAAHYACMPELQAYDVALYGGTPADLPELYAERNPMTYVDRVRAPVLVIAGENDPRCPPEGITPWVDALRARGIPVDVRFYQGGHHAGDLAERVRQTELVLDFFRRHLEAPERRV
jgi:dipeptidyl aminopeptidase/acylaminoacyl peptidase